MSCGSGFRSLTMIIDAKYEFTDSELVLSDPVIKHEGSLLRLGHRHEGEVVYSDGWEVPHQPFQHSSGRYYTLDAKMWRDGEVVIEPWAGYKELGNPWVDGDTIWFEVLPTGAVGVDVPGKWQIWTCDLGGNDKKYICNGANPCVYKGKLYYGIWKVSRFDYAIKD